MPTPGELVRGFVRAMNTSDMATVADSFDPEVEAYTGNAAAVFCRLSERGRIAAYRMVEALPAESDRFWAAES